MLDPQIVYWLDIFCTFMTILIVIEIFRLHKIIRGRVAILFLLAYFCIMVLRFWAVAGYAAESHGWYFINYIFLFFAWRTLRKQVTAIIHTPVSKPEAAHRRAEEVFAKAEEAHNKAQEVYTKSQEAVLAAVEVIKKAREIYDVRK